MLLLSRFLHIVYSNSCAVAKGNARLQCVSAPPTTSRYVSVSLSPPTTSGQVAAFTLLLRGMPYYLCLRRCIYCLLELNMRCDAGGVYSCLPSKSNRRSPSPKKSFLFFSPSLICPPLPSSLTSLALRAHEPADPCHFRSAPLPFPPLQASGHAEGTCCRLMFVASSWVSPKEPACRSKGRKILESSIGYCRALEQDGNGPKPP